MFYSKNSKTTGQFFWNFNITFLATYGYASDLYASARWPRRGIVVPFVRRRLNHRPPYIFGYYTNMVQQITQGQG